MGMISDEEIARIQRMGQSPRERELQELWVRYTCSRYEHFKFDWDGTEHLDSFEREVVEIGRGFQAISSGASNKLPLKYRRPHTPYHLSRIIVDRFTSLLFSKNRHPSVRVPGNPLTEDYANALIRQSRLWARMISARAFGGATGTVAVGFKFVDGQVQIEVHYPGHLTPAFKDEYEKVIGSIEKRYQTPRDEWDAEKKKWKTVWYWYRRVIDEEYDSTYELVPVGEGDQAGIEPKWVLEPAKKIRHGLGFVPMVWIQNLPVEDGIDGDSDTTGVDDLSHAMDRLLSQAYQGVFQNSDPTAVLRTEEDIDDELRKGSFNSLFVGKDGDAKYLEAAMSGPKEARELFGLMRKLGLEMASCVLDHPDVANRTAKEIERLYESMVAKADVLREQYGHAIVRLVEMMLKAARIKGNATLNYQSQQGETQSLKLPPRVETVEDENGERKTVVTERKLGPEGGHLEIVWPDYFDAGPADRQKAVETAAQAKGAGLLDDATAIGSVAPVFHVEDVQALVKKIKLEAIEREDRTMSDITKGIDHEEPDADEKGGPGDADADEAKPAAGADPQGEAAPGQEIQTKTDTVLNGAQISAATDLVAQVVAGKVPEDAALGILQIMFNLTVENAKLVLGSAGDKADEKAKEPAPPPFPPPQMMPGVPKMPAAREPDDDEEPAPGAKGKPGKE